MVVQQPMGANFNSSTKSIAYYNYTSSAFLSDVAGADIVISDKNVVALINSTNFPDNQFRDFITKKLASDSSLLMMSPPPHPLMWLQKASRILRELNISLHCSPWSVTEIHSRRSMCPSSRRLPGSIVTIISSPH